MTSSQKLQLRESQIKARMIDLDKVESLSEDETAEVEKLTGEYREVQTKKAAAIVAEDETAEVRETQTDTTDDGETRELRELRGKVNLGEYVRGAIEMRSARGAEAEYNQHLGIGGNQFPLSLLAPEAKEVRDTTGAEAQANQGSWLDRLFADSAAARVGVSMRSVAPGLASYPVTTAGASGAAQDREEVTTDAAWTVGVTEARPKRASVRAVFTLEDAARMPGLEDALRRDLGMALMDHLDKSVFVGDAGPSTAAYKIVGLNTAANVAERSITQNNKIKSIETLTEFAALVDGVYASGFGDLGIVAAVGAWRLWASTIVNASADNMTLAQFLEAAGLSYMARGGIEALTTNNKFGAFVGRMRSNEGAAIAAVWSAGELIRDPYSGAADGEVALTLNYLRDFVIPRPAQFARVKFVSN